MTPTQIDRYARHLVLKEVGGAGQNALLAASVAIVGAGGLGGPVALYLAAAGVGQISLFDDDTISLSNLQRQIQFNTNEVGQSKVKMLAKRLFTINPDTRCGQWPMRITSENAKVLLADHDLVVDGTDSFAARFAINAAAVALNIPLISGAVGRFDAQVGVFAKPGPCYRCFVPDLPPHEETCAEVGVLGALTGIAGSVMAMEAIKWITGAGQPLRGRLWMYDGLSAESRTVKIVRDPACSACGG